MATLKPMIWAKQTILITAENTRGGGLKDNNNASILMAKTGGTIDPQHEFIKDDSSHGTIFDTFAVRKVKSISDMNLSGYLSFNNIRKLIEAVVGTTVFTTADGYSEYSVKNDNTHQTFAITQVTGDYYTENGDIEILTAPYCSLDSLEFSVSNGNFASYSAHYLGSEAQENKETRIVKKVKDSLKKEQAREKSSSMIDFTQVKLFVQEDPKTQTWFADFMASVKTGTIQPMAISNLSFNFVKNLETIGRVGSFEVETYNKQFGFGGSFEKLKNQDDWAYENYVGKDLFFAVVFYNEATPTLCLFCQKVMLDNKTTNDSVGEMLKENITFTGAFSGSISDTLKFTLNDTAFAKVENLS